jgi:hypothetical protein
VASVLSGGTGINVGFFIHEVEEYINSLGKSPGVTIQKALLQEVERKMLLFFNNIFKTINVKYIYIFFYSIICRL